MSNGGDGAGAPAVRVLALRLWPAALALLLALAAAAAVTEHARGASPGALVVSWDRYASGEPELRGYPTNGTCGGLLAYGSHATFSADASRLAYQTLTGSTQQIFAANPDGSSPTQITFDGAGAYRPAFSPDGSRIAFESDRNGSREVWTIGADGSDATPLTGPGTYHPVYSPDGASIAFVRGGGNDWQVYLMNEDGSDQRQLTFQPNFYPRSPWFSADGQRLIFEVDNQGTLAEVGVDGRGFRWLPLGGENFAISPDEEWYARSFRTHEKPGGSYFYGHLWVGRADGTDQQPLHSSRINWDVKDITWRPSLPTDGVECADFSPPEPPEPPDPFEFSHDAVSAQRVGRSIKVSVRCNAACRASLTGAAVIRELDCPPGSCAISQIRLRAGKSVVLAADQTRTLRLKTGRKARRTMRRAIRGGRRVEVEATVRVFDPARERFHEADLTIRLSA